MQISAAHKGFPAYVWTISSPSTGAGDTRPPARGLGPFTTPSKPSCPRTLRKPAKDYGARIAFQTVAIVLGERDGRLLSDMSRQYYGQGQAGRVVNTYRDKVAAKIWMADSCGRPDL
ncbi:MAG: hypothetical protein JWM11_4055 [Planctomycetaceae bacterium]|nr:hypothetical protein [Planctomycetaceae bacterium]